MWNQVMQRYGMVCKGKERYAKAKVKKSKESNGKIRKGNQR